jgi:ATP synthase protein I
VKNHQALKEQVAKQVARMKQAEKDRPTLLAQTAYIGTLGLLFVLPVIAGAYFGDWLDSQFEGYSILWTMSMIFLGVIVGAVNVYLFIGE